MKTKETPSQQSARLLSTENGRALLALIDKYPSKAELAEALGSSREYISRCLHKGEISRSGALLADAKGLMAKEALRPDVQDWSAVPPGPLIGAKPSRDGVAQVLLRDLAIHHGSVKAFCKVAGVSVATFHDWNTRGRISASGMLKLVAMRGLSRGLLARIMMEVDCGSKGG